MAIDSVRFEEREWRKPLRHLKESLYVVAGGVLGRLGLLNSYPKNPVFIIGSPRSGTSIFNKMVDAHPEIANLSEAIYIWDPKDKDPSRDHVKNAEGLKPSDEKRIRYTFGFYQLLKGRPCFVNKCPRSSVRIPYIARIFPDAKFIHVYRDGRDVVNSMINIIRREDFRKDIPLGDFCKPEKWRDLVKLPDIVAHGHQWVDIMKEIEQGKGGVTAENWLDIKYEDFCIEPKKMMLEVFDFMDIAVNQQLLDEVQSMPAKNDQKWRTSFSADQLDKLNEIMHDSLKFYGYDI